MMKDAPIRNPFRSGAIAPENGGGIGCHGRKAYAIRSEVVPGLVLITPARQNVRAA
jgi:hypothetical protein